MDIRSGSASDDEILVEHYMALWESYGTPPEHYRSDARECVRAFLQDGRERLQLRTFFAFDGSEIAGSAACRLHEAPYPNVIDPAYRKFGYIWHVFVRPEFQRRGLGKALTQAAIDYFRSINCTAVVLNASEAGAPLYRAMGFEAASEMRLKL